MTWKIWRIDQTIDCPKKNYCFVSIVVAVGVGAGRSAAGKLRGKTSTTMAVGSPPPMSREPQHGSTPPHKFPKTTWNTSDSRSRRTTMETVKNWFLPACRAPARGCCAGTEAGVYKLDRTPRPVSLWLDPPSCLFSGSWTTI